MIYLALTLQTLLDTQAIRSVQGDSDCGGYQGWPLYLC